MLNPEDITDSTTTMNMALALMAKAFKLNYSTPTNNNQRISSNPRNRQIAQPGMNIGQDRQMQMVGGNGGNQFRQYAGNLNGSTEVHENCDDNEIFNMLIQEEQYTKLLKPIPESHQVPQNDNDVISEVTHVEQVAVQNVRHGCNDTPGVTAYGVALPNNQHGCNHTRGVTAQSRDGCG
nr:hypothetical protein [Tanacetum cinerariifolium]